MLMTLMVSCMVDGDSGLWSLFVDDATLGDGGAVEMPDDGPLMEITLMYKRCVICLMMEPLHLMTLMVMALGP